MDEHGAEAAAATGVADCLLCGYLPREPLRVNADHPVLVAIVDKQDVPLFLGHLSDPEPLQK